MPLSTIACAMPACASAGPRVPGPNHTGTLTARRVSPSQQDELHLLHVVPDVFTSPASGSIYYCSSPDPETERLLVRAPWGAPPGVAAGTAPASKFACQSTCSCSSVAAAADARQAVGRSAVRTGHAAIGLAAAQPAIQPVARCDALWASCARCLRAALAAVVPGQAVLRGQLPGARQARGVGGRGVPAPR